MSVQGIPAPTPVENKQLDNTEAPSSAPEASGTKEDLLSPKFAALARREKAIRAEKRQFEQDREKFQSEREQMKKELEDYRARMTRLTQDPYSVLMEQGVTADQAAALMMNQPDPQSQTIQQLKAELAALKGEQTNAQKRVEEQQAQQYEQAKKQIRNDVKLLVDGDESFEALKANGDGALDAVVDLVEKTFQKDGYVMPLEQAAKEVEDYLAEEAFRFASLKKVQARLAPPPALPEATKQPANQQHQTKPMQTLSNRSAPSTPSRLSEKERRERAIAAFRGQLTS